MAPYSSRVHFVREMSFNAVSQFQDCSLDFVYVDAVHDYEGALRDIMDWWPKLKPGGILAGHDYLDQINPAGIFGVKSAADRFAMAVNRVVVFTSGYPIISGMAKSATDQGILEWSSFIITK